MNKDLLFKSAAAKNSLQSASQVLVCEFIKKYCTAIETNVDLILAENLKDLERMDPNNSKYDRLLLNRDRVFSITADARKIADIAFDPFAVLEEKIGSNGIEIKKISCPFGVVGMIFESRPNVVVDAIAICLKTHNICVLKGSDEARFSNSALVSIAKNTLKSLGLSEDFVNLLDSDRSSVMDLISAKNIVDLVIPRGGQGLIEFVRDNSMVPVIETGAGVVHIYIDEFADLDIASKVVFNAKTRKPSVCNTLDCLVIHKNQIQNFAEIVKNCIDVGVYFYVDQMLSEVVKNIPNIKYEIAADEAFGCEFLSLKMSVKLVDSYESAIDFINKNGSHHSDAIITSDENSAKTFTNLVDSAAVYVNCSTAFSDGGCFGLGSEIGISTQKLHARGPFALDALRTYKYIIHGDGNVR
jgi:glutamate-5-semialdehyde dehydrogenase